MVRQKWIGSRLNTLLAGVVVLTMVLLVIPANVALASPLNVVIFSDDFEYDDSLENHGWTIEMSNPQGDPQTATDPEDAGNRVAYLQSRAEDFSTFPMFYHSFSELPLQPGMEISVKFYDTGDSCGNCDVWTTVFFDNESGYIMVGWYNSPTSFDYAYQISGTYYGDFHEPYGLRSVGWHTFMWRVEQSGGIDLLIDGNLIIDDLMGFTTLSRFRVNTGSDPNTYSFAVDDFLTTSEGECVTTSTGTGTACFVASNGTIEDLQALPTIPPGAPTVFPHGMFTFKITGLSNGEEVTLTIELPDPVPVGTKWWKYHNNTWSAMDIGDDDGDRVITVALQDGRTPDDEDSTSGQITDQGGPGDPGAVGWQTHPVSKVRVLLPWIALAVILAGGTGWYVRRRSMVQS